MNDNILLDKNNTPSNYHQTTLDELPVIEYDDPVYHPSHYNSGNIEVIDIIADQLGDKGMRGFCLGNALKYICRSGKKDKTKEKEDIEKAIWYLNRYLKEN